MGIIDIAWLIVKIVLAIGLLIAAGWLVWLLFVFVLDPIWSILSIPFEALERRQQEKRQAAQVLLEQAKQEEEERQQREKHQREDEERWGKWRQSPEGNAAKEWYRNLPFPN